MPHALAPIPVRVQAGIDWLDSHVEGWRSKIDVAALDLFECQACVLGQLFWRAGLRQDDWESEYSAGTGYVGALTAISENYDIGDPLVFAMAHGFEVARCERYADLTEAWRTALATHVEVLS